MPSEFAQETVIDCSHNLIFEKTGAKKETSLMIGDSLLSDVAGALQAGIDVCWYNPRQKSNETKWKPNFEISRLGDVKKYL
jgi:FMN phosphatase YigB (HAD superfamily)